MTAPESHHSSYQDRWLAQLHHALSQRHLTHTYRTLTSIAGPQGPTLRIGTRELIQFCTNNYLGLANDLAVVDAAREALERYGMGAGASRLVAGSMELHQQLETELARFKGTESALVFSTGFMANLAVLTTFAQGPENTAGERKSEVRIISDKLNHASLLDAARYSGAEHRVFPHLNYPRAAELLARPLRGQELGDGQTFLVTDSVFSMDGDLADLTTLCGLARAHEALVIIDEAHGTGVLGEHGHGLAEAQGVESDIAITVGTLSKAFGSVGGFVCAAKPVIEMLINAGRAFIYTTALPPACSAASLAALRIIQSPEGKQRRERVCGLAAQVRQELTQLGFDCGQSQTPIIPVLLGSSERAVRASALLEERGIWVPAIRPPTVPPNQARLRISLMATHRDSDIEQLLAAFKLLRDVL